MLKYLDVLIGFVVVMSLASMAIMAITQVASSLINLRGRNLRDGLQAMFLSLVPEKDKEKLKGLADAVLKHPLLSDSPLTGNSRRLAAALRPDELVKVLQNLAQAGQRTMESKAWLPKVDDKSLEALSILASDVLKAFAPPNSTLPTNIASFFDAGFKKMVEEAEKWCGTMQDRVSEWFTTHAQWWNVVIAIVVAVGFQLDSFKLLDELSTNDKLRAELLSTAPFVQERAEALTKSANKTFDAGLAAVVKLTPDEKAALSTTPAPADETSAKAALIAKGIADPRAGEVATPYAKAYQETAAKELEIAKDTAASVRKTVKEVEEKARATGFNLIPSAEKYWEFWEKPKLGSLFGVIFTILLLSLGAPYWFNLLKTLTNFRSKLAQAVDAKK